MVCAENGLLRSDGRGQRALSALHGEEVRDATYAQVLDKNTQKAERASFQRA